MKTLVLTEPRPAASGMLIVKNGIVVIAPPADDLPPALLEEQDLDYSIEAGADLATAGLWPDGASKAMFSKLSELIRLRGLHIINGLGIQRPINVTDLVALTKAINIHKKPAAR